MSKTYDLTKIPDILRAVAKAKNIKWSLATSNKGGALISFKNPSAKKLAWAAGILGVKVSQIYQVQEGLLSVESITESGGTPITGEQGGDPVTGTEEGGTPVQP
jgi:hypothetical protein